MFKSLKLLKFKSLKEIKEGHPELLKEINVVLVDLFGANIDEVTADWSMTEKSEESYKQEDGMADNVYGEFFRKAGLIAADYAEKKGIENNFGFGETETEEE